MAKERHIEVAEGVVHHLDRDPNDPRNRKNVILPNLPVVESPAIPPKDLDIHNPEHANLTYDELQELLKAE